MAEALTLFPCSYSTDITDLKTTVIIDSVSNTNVGLTCPVDSSFIKENSLPDPQMLYSKIVTVVVVGSITTFGNKMPLSLIVEYFPKSGKAGDFLAELCM